MKKKIDLAEILEFKVQKWPKMVKNWTLDPPNLAKKQNVQNSSTMIL